MLKIKFLGALNEIGNSGILIESEKERILLDYGLKVKENPPKFPLKVSNVHTILVSHAHLDHIGSLPILSSKKLKIYSVKPTKEMAKIVLEDNIKVLNEEGIFIPFNKNDVEKIISKFRNVEYNKKLRRGKFEFSFLNAGHILGSAMIKIENEKLLLYTGDFKLFNTTLHNGCEKVKAEILIMETTYWNKIHPNREELEKEFVENVEETLNNGGIVLLPSLAVGRTQEIIGIFGKYDIDAEIYVEGMAAKVTEIYKKYCERIENKKYFIKGIEKVKFVRSKKERKKILKEKQKIVVCGSGMLDGGPAIYYARKICNDKNSSIFLTCYQLPDTPGRILIERKKLVTKNEIKNVECNVNYFDFSTHSDRNELIKFIEIVNPEIIFLVHGENISGFLEDLKDYNVFIPTYEKNSFIIP
jgi:putative mRNA 3-end processing factor